MQYFIGYSSFTDEEPFDASLFVGIRKRLDIERINEINERIVALGLPPQQQEDRQGPPTHKGTMLIDATVAPQEIAYPTDLDLLNEARMKSQDLINKLYIRELHGVRPSTYRKIARKMYLKTAQKKRKGKKVVRKAVGQQLRFLARNLRHIDRLLDSHQSIPLKPKDYKCLLVIKTLYGQQRQMYAEKSHSIAHRTVSIHQPHVRPIVRGKAHAHVEFGSKLQLTMMGGFAFLDKLSWEAFNEGTHLISSIEKYRQRFGAYPKKVLADKIYCNRENRRMLKELGITLAAKPLGRPRAGERSLVRPGERNPIEGKFGQAKRAYGLGKVRTRLAKTRESWVASILMVFNLVKLIGGHPYGYTAACSNSPKNLTKQNTNFLSMI